MPYEGEIEVNNLPQGTTLNEADEVMLIDNSTGELKLFEVASLGAVISTDNGVTNEIKQALLQIARKVVYIDDDGPAYYDDLYHALYPGNLVSITAVYDSTHKALAGDSLDSLKPYLTVTAHYDDNTNRTVTNYILYGSLNTTGTNAITVSYTENLTSATTTFDVATVAVSSISAVFTQGEYIVYDSDSLDSLRQFLVVTVTYTDSSTATVTAYTLSGTLTSGTSTITVSYEGKTTTFNVTVTADEALFRLRNHTSTRTAPAVDSGVAIMSTDQSFTITFDGVQSTIPLDSKALRLFYCMTSSTNWKGIYLGCGVNDTSILAQWCTSSNATGLWNRNANNKRIRVVYVHTAGSGNAIIYVKVDNGSLTTKTMTASFLSNDGSVCFCNDPGDNAKGWVGTVTEITLLGRVMTSDEITAFMA